MADPRYVMRIADRVMRIGSGKQPCWIRRMSHAESKSEITQKRLSSFAAQVIRLSATLPDTPEATHIRKQILRSGTAVAANYAEARAAESRADFIHKLRIALKELNETAVWLQMIGETGLISEEKTFAIVAENRELCRIIAASIKRAGGFERRQ